MSSSKPATSKKAKGEKSKSQSKAQSKQRPQAAASALHQAPADASSVGRSCAFTSDGTRFVLVARAGATERVRVFDAQTGRLQSEAALDGTGAGTKVSCLSWVGLDLDTVSTTSVTEDASRKKRKKRKSDAGDNMAVDETTTASSEKPLLVALGRADGSISLFSPSHGRLVRTLSHAQSTTPILALSLAAHDQPRLWTSSEDGLLRLWDARKNVLLGIWKTEEHTPFSALALSPAAFIDAPSALLAAHHGIRLLSVPEGAETNDIEGVKLSTGTLQATASCTGHASPVSSLQWVSPTQIASSAPDDRTLSFWTLPSASNSSSSSEGTLACTIPLSSPVRSFSVSPDASLVLAVSNGNVASIHALPASFKANEAPGKKIPTVSASASVSLGAQRGVTKVEIAAASFVHDQEGTVRIVRLVGGVKPIFDLVVCLCRYYSRICTVN
jgi:U3 small nucleolar RNA-associated protein 5